MSNIPLIPRTALFGNPERISPKISPDGKMLAYQAPLNGVMNVYVGSTSPADEPRPVTSDSLRGIRAYFWQQDSTHILYVQDSGGDENWRLYQTNIATRETRDLTPFTGVQARLIALDPRFPDVILIGLNQRDARLHDVYQVNLITGSLTLLVENTDGFAQYHADNQLRIRAAHKMLANGGTEIYVRDDTNAPWRKLVEWNADETGGILGFSPDDDRLYLLSSLDANAARLVDMSLTSEDKNVIAEDPLYDVGGVLTNPISNHLEAVAFVRAKTEWEPLNATIRADFDFLASVRDGVVNIVSRDDSDSLWTVGYVTDTGPVYFYLYDRSAQSATFLFASRLDLETYTLASMVPVEFDARDGMHLYGYLTTPVDSDGKNLPLIVLVHGGPWARDAWGFNPWAQLLANRGYAVLQINFRGSSGYGKAYLNAGDREWGAKMHEDLLDGKAWAIAQGIADPNRVAIMGGSYGGYATLAALAFTPDAFSCGVDIVGPSNLNTLIASIPPYWEPIRALFTKRMGDNEAFLTERSPLFQAHRIVKPLLVGQGANDPRVKIAESDQIVQAMRTAGKPVEYVVFPDEGHGFARPENTLFFAGKTEEFLATHLGGRVEPFVPIVGSTGEVR